MVGEPIRGTVARRFEPVREAFAALDVPGAALAVAVEGELVVDLWSGVGWERDTLVHVYSATKPLAALCVLRLVDEGRLDLDQRIVSVWPEYGAGGKEATTVRHALAHQTGVNAFSEPQPVELLLDWDGCVAQIAAESPAWAPGSRHGEQALLYGHVLGELVRRIDGRSLGAYFREVIAEPLSLDTHIGVVGEVAARVADVDDPAGRCRAQLLAEASDLKRRALDNPPAILEPSVVNSDRWRAAEIPAVNGHATARSLARLYSALALGGELDGVRILGEDVLAEALRVQAQGPDAVFGNDVAFGLGWRLDGGNFRCAEFGFGGVGGSVAYGNRTRRLALAFVTRSLAGFDRAAALERSLLPLL